MPSLAEAAVQEGVDGPLAAASGAVVAGYPFGGAFGHPWGLRGVYEEVHCRQSQEYGYGGGVYEGASWGDVCHELAATMMMPPMIPNTRETMAHVSALEELDLALVESPMAHA